MLEVEAVCIKDVTYSYPNAPSAVLRNVDFLFSAGRVSVISGPSGTGKSTLLDIVGGLRPPSSGTLELVGGPKGRMPGSREWRAQFSWVLQSNTLLGARKVLDNIALGLVATGLEMSVARNMALRSLEDFGMTELAHRTAGSLSGGEAQRITILRSRLSRRPIVIADEPTGQLDSASTEKVVDFLAGTARAGKVVIVASHDPTVWAAADDHLELGRP